MLFEKEKNTIGVLYDFLKDHPRTILDVEFEGVEPFQAIRDTAYETDNGLDTDEPGYEEYNAITLERLDNGELEELTYKHFPKRITCNGVFVVGTEAP